MKYKQIQIVDRLGDEATSVAPIHFSMTSYGADYPVSGLVKMMKSGDIFVPDFQRNFVWSKIQASRFIESLLLGLPVPGIFLSKEYETEKYLIIDGQQRLKTLQYYCEGRFYDQEGDYSIFNLTGVQDEYENIAFFELPEKMRRRLENSLIHATIVKQDKPPGDDTSIYYLFERLNTGETRLEAQEIRSCVYHGKFNDLIKKLNKNQDWRDLFGPPNIRMRDEELIVRFLALLHKIDEYQQPMKGFLNDFMKNNIKLQTYNEDILQSSFSDVIKVINDIIGSRAFKRKGPLNAAIVDSLMIGMHYILPYIDTIEKETIVDCYDKLMKDRKYVHAISQNTGSVRNVNKRIELAIKYFNDAI